MTIRGLTDIVPRDIGDQSESFPQNRLCEPPHPQKREPELNWVIKVLRSSLGKKYLMAVTGLMLCGFLVVHLSGNFLMYVGPEAYNTYAKTLHSQEWFVKTAEVGLLAVFSLHLYLAYATTRDSMAARSQRYEVKQTKQEGKSAVAADTWMLISGAIVFVFVVFHLIDFTIEARWDFKYEEFEHGKYYSKAIALLSSPWSILYLVGTIVLGFHLVHGFASAFQSLGLNGPKWDPLILWASRIFAVVIGLGFASLAIWGLFMLATTSSSGG